MNPISAWGKRSRKKFDAGRRQKAARQRSEAKAQTRAKKKYVKYMSKQWKGAAKAQAKERARQRKNREKDEREFKKRRRKEIMAAKVKSLGGSASQRKRIYKRARRIQRGF